INPAPTSVTSLRVFLTQRSQNKDSLAIHLKLNEIVAALEGASNRLISVEDLTEDEIHLLRQHYQRLVKIAGREESLTRSHSIEEAEARHRFKARQRQQRQPSPAGDSSRPSAPACNRPPQALA